MARALTPLGGERPGAAIVVPWCGRRARGAASPWVVPLCSGARATHPVRQGRPPPTSVAGGPRAALRAGTPLPRRQSSEAHLPAQRPQTGEAPRVPASHGHSRRACRARVAAPQGAGTSVGLTWSIRDRATFGELRAAGRRARRGALTVTFAPPRSPTAPQSPSTPPRVAYAVSRRVGTAVVRNRVRRRLRTAVAAIAGAEPQLLPPGAYLISASPAAARQPAAQLRHALEAALEALLTKARKGEPAR